jgi:hypothetical protein
MDRFELAPVDRNARFRQQAYLSAKRDKLDANLTDRRPVIFAEIGNRFVIGDKPAGEPHDLNVAPATLVGVDTGARRAQLDGGARLITQGRGRSDHPTAD